jgi:uncharacterized sulfatase
MFGNDNRWVHTPNPKSLASVFQRHGYQTALVGKSHMVPAWDHSSFEYIRYTDLIDADISDPLTNHYFGYLDQRGLSDLYGEGAAKEGQGIDDGSTPALLPYEHSIEHFTGEQSLAFLGSRDESRPFFLKMSFQRPHGPITPAPEHFDMYDPDSLTLPDNAFDYFENRFSGKPKFMQEKLQNGCNYPLADPDPSRLRRCLASYYTLISEIDMEIGRVLDCLDEADLLEDTVIFYTADHGDFAGEHGLFHKNFGIYDSIHRIPFLLAWPGGPRGITRARLVESVDWYPTLCRLCDVSAPENIDGHSLIPTPGQDEKTKDAVFCEWDNCSAIRTRDWRLVIYRNTAEGELYDLQADPGETCNLWNNPDAQQHRLFLLERLLRFTLGYSRRTGPWAFQYSPTQLVQFGRCYWSDLKRVYDTSGIWPPGKSRETTNAHSGDAVGFSAERGWCHGI